MLIITAVLIGVLTGFVLGRYSIKPINEIPPIKAIHERIETIKEVRAVKKLTPEEYEENQKANTFYN